MPDILTKAEKSCAEILEEQRNAPHSLNNDRFYCPKTGYVWRGPYESKCRHCDTPLVEGMPQAAPEGKNVPERNLTQSTATPERIWLMPGQAQDPTECTLSHVNTDGHTGIPYIREQAAPPETVTVGLPVLRAVILAVIDDGIEEKPPTRPPFKDVLEWYFYHTDEAKANEQRERFCDEIERRLKGLKRHVTRG